jgi:stage II sporulation protein D (peptidoglycan lytic transglycosylase)
VRGRALAAALAAAALLASCAPLPPPQSPAPPPARSSGGVPPASAAFRLDHEPAVDIGLAWDQDTLRISGDLRIRSRDLGDHSERMLRVGLGASGMQVGADPRARQALGPDDTLWVSAADPRAGLGWNGKTWRGTFRIFMNPRHQLTLAVRLPLETYLLGVVPGEIGALAESLVEAGKAQAIAARSYTLYYLGRRAAEGFDLFGTVEDQVYGPVESERPLATRCVEETRGRAVLADGRPIRANYCANCGGISAEAWEAWATGPQPYLVSHPDRDGAFWCSTSPLYRWREEWTPAEMASNLARFGPVQQVVLPAAGVGEILDVGVDARSRSGRVWALTVRTSTGSIVVPAYALRFVLRRGGNPNAILRSNLFKIDVRRDPATRRALAIVASGAGSGHGVGLCQTGALGMARGGRKAADILHHYYPGARTERLY